jgi:hypothetical protein
VLQADQAGHVRLVRDVEEHRGGADHQRTGVQQRHGAVAEQRRHHHDAERERAHQVGDDQHAALAHPVHPGAGRQADHQERGGLGGGERPHLPLGRLEGLHREDGQRQAGELCAELAEGVADPEPAEVGVVHQRPAGRGLRLRGHAGSLAALIGKSQSVRLGA